MPIKFQKISRFLSSRKSFYKFRLNKAFTISELLVSSLISTAVLIAGYSLVRTTIEANKSDESYLKLSAKVDNALDFVIDEINSSKRVLDDKSQIPANCPQLTSGEDFVIGVKLPDQAIDLSAYSSSNMANKSKIWKSIDCPIVYTLRKDSKTSGKHGSYYQLMRRGPALNEKGYYIPTKIENNIISDNIRHAPIDEMHCDTNSGWKYRKVRGIIICTDKNRRAAEVGISADLTKNYSKSQYLSRSSGGYSRIQDDDLIGNIAFGSGTGNACTNCNLFGTPVSSNKITFFIDISGSMNWGSIKGKKPMEAAKFELMQSIRKLPDGFYFQVIAFNSGSRPVFRGGPQKMNSSTRAQALTFVSRLRAGGGTNPWSGVWSSMLDQNVGQIILMSDGWTRTSSYCQYTKRTEKIADCLKYYNDNVRSKTPTGTVSIDTVSIKNDFCRAGGWMGELSSKNQGNCSVIK